MRDLPPISPLVSFVQLLAGIGLFCIGFFWLFASVDVLPRLAGSLVLALFGFLGDGIAYLVRDGPSGRDQSRCVRCGALMSAGSRCGVCGAR
jgi:apolipoprotein N-acyltransferase